MNRKILLNQIEKMTKNIEPYVSIEELEQQLSSLDLQILKKQVENQEFVITVVGAMKSGKSSFTNALLGQDLMPNENQACTLTTTDIIHQNHDFFITKRFDSGKQHILESENLSSVFHEDVRRSRQEEIEDFYTYQVNYPIYSLKKYPLLNDQKFILMDTPGLNEMEGLGVKKDTIEKVFEQALRRTDLLFFVLDVQYYKSEENHHIIQKIYEQRPDLLDSAVFIVNKVDSIRERDGLLEDLLNKVKSLLCTWGVNTKKIFPVSTKKALLGRLIEQGIDAPLLQEDISSFLPVESIEINGKMRTIQLTTEEAAPKLIEESGMLELEEQVLENVYLQVDQRLQQSFLDRLTQINEQMDETLEKAQTTMNQKSIKLQQNLRVLGARLEVLENLESGVQVYSAQIEEILSEIRLKGQDMMNIKSYFPGVPDPGIDVSSYTYNSSYEAEQVGISRFDEWFHKHTEPLFQRILTHYNSILEYKADGSNYFHIKTLSLNQKLKEINKLIETSQRKLPDLKISTLVSPLDIRAKGLRDIPNIDWKYKQFSGNIFTESQTDEWEESFLIFFTQKKSKTSYRYNLKFAAKQAKKHIEDSLLSLSTRWHKEVIQNCYIDVHNLIEKSILEPVRRIHKDVDPHVKKVKMAIKQLEKEIEDLHSVRQDIKGLQQDLGFRTDLLTKRKTIIVESTGIELDKILFNAEPGTTIILKEGHYYLKQRHDLSKTIAIIGVGYDRTTIEFNNSGGISLNGNHGLLLIGITFKSSTTIHMFEVNCLELLIEKCHFSNVNLGYAITIKGETQGYIFNSEFSLFEGAIKLSNNSKLELNSNSFFNNQKFALEMESYSNNNLVENTFLKNHIGVSFKDFSQGTLVKNNLSENIRGVMVSGNATPIITENHISKNKECGILLELESNPNIEGNFLIENGVGVYGSSNAKAEITKNIFKNNQGTGLLLNGKFSGRVNENQFYGNETGISISSSEVVHIEKNHIFENRLHGIICLKDSRVNAYANQIEFQLEYGLLIKDNSHMKIDGNKVTGNKVGILIEGRATFTLEKNKCLQNDEQGVVIQEEAKGTAKENICNNNRDGVLLTGRSTVLWQENICEENLNNGIVCDKKMSGTIHRNSCHKNGEFSLLIKKTLRIDHVKNEGKGSLEKISSWSHWINQWKKLSSKIKASMKKKEKMNYEY